MPRPKEPLRTGGSRCSIRARSLAPDSRERPGPKAAAAIVDELPEVVYISFDIDGLTIEHCPHTGTPVPGGITFEQVVYLMECVADSGRRIAGFDLVEVVPCPEDKIDAVVGAACSTNCAAWPCGLRRQEEVDSDRA